MSKTQTNLNNASMPVGCVVMAAGSSQRFGGNKLMAQFAGSTLIELALEALPTEYIFRVCVVTQYDEIEALAAQYGFMCLRNDRPDLGVSRTVRLGTEALMDSCKAILYTVADQPCLGRSTVEDQVKYFLSHPDHIVALSHDGVRGNPVIFPERFFPELCALTGDTGGSAVIKRHTEDLLLYEADIKELTDVDTPEALEMTKGPSLCHPFFFS